MLTGALLFSSLVVQLLAPSSCSVHSNASSRYVALETPIKGICDPNVYKAAKLSNGITVVAMYTPALSVSGAALCIKLGRFDDPDEFKGATAFVGKRVLVASQKYPRAYAFKELVFIHNGQYSETIDEEFSTFDFCVSHSRFEEALDMFSQAFIAPKFGTSKSKSGGSSDEGASHSLDEEPEIGLLALDSSKTREERPAFDYQSVVNVVKKIASRHVVRWHRFYRYDEMDMRATKRDDFNERMETFFRENYSADRMKVVVFGKKKVNELLDLAVEAFGGIATCQSSSKPKTSGLPFGKEELATITTVESGIHKDSVVFCWQLPSACVSHLDKPEEYFMRLLKDSGEGSLAACLKSRNLANSLHCVFEKYHDFGLMLIVIETTKPGMERREEIFKAVAAYLEFLRHTPIERWILCEKKQLDEVSFNLPLSTNSPNYPTIMAQNLHHYPTQHVVFGKRLIENTKVDPVAKILAELTSQNLQLFVIANDEEIARANQTKKYRYAREKIPTEMQEKFSRINHREYPEFALPQRNAYISHEYDIPEPEDENEPAPDTLPVQIITNVLWHYRFSLAYYPTADVAILVQNTQTHPWSAKTCILNSLFAGCLKEAIEAKFYAATLVDYSFSASATQEGIIINCSGYHEKLFTLAQQILKTLFAYVPDKVSFNRELSAQRESMHKTKTTSATEKVQECFWHFLEPTMFSQEDLQNAIASVTHEDMLEFCKLMDPEKFGFKVLVAGNATPSAAVNLVWNLDLPELFSYEPFTKVRTIKPQTEQLLYRYHEGTASAVALFFECPCQNNIRLRILLDLYYRMFMGKFLPEAMLWDINPHSCKYYPTESQESRGLLMSVEIDQKSCPEIEQLLLDFVTSTHKAMAQEPEGRAMFFSAIQRYKMEMQLLLTNKPQRTARYFNMITSAEYGFDRFQRIHATVESITVKEMIQFIRDYFMPDGRHRRFLSVWVLGYSNLNVDVGGRKQLHELDDYARVDTE